MSIQILQQGSGELIGWHDPDENRQWVREHKSRDLRDKRMSVKEAVEEFVHDGNFIAFGGFGHIRIPMAVVYEIIRQQKRGLVMAGKTAVHDIDLLIGAGCVNKVEVAYAFGHELRGLSPAGRRAVETGQCKVVAEISNAGYHMIDVYGNLNTTVIGEWEHPTARLPGSGGANDIGSLCHRTIIVMRQDKRRFVERVNFITTPGYLDGPGARERAGLPEGTGPHRVITQLGVYDFDEQTKRLRLLDMHPGVTPEEIQANSAFAVPVPERVGITTPPTEDERRLLREIDPAGMVIGK